MTTVIASIVSLAGVAAARVLIRYVLGALNGTAYRPQRVPVRVETEWDRRVQLRQRNRF